MTVSRRRLIGFFPLFVGLFLPRITASQPYKPAPREVLGHVLHDDVSISLLNTYARSLALADEDARWEAQIMFHESQLARRLGGTMSHKLGYRHKDFLEACEEGRAVDKSSPLWK